MKVKYPVKDKVILTISDMHIPYHHPDALEFLNELKKQYKPDLVISLGDMLDFHNISFHDSDPDLLSSGDELARAREQIKRLEKLFPEMVIIGSNHGDLPIRRAVNAGLPRELFKSYNDIYGVSAKWKFVDDLMLEDKGGKLYYFTHGISKNGAKLAAQRGVCTVQGHYHTDCRIDYISNPRDLLWSLQAGCLIDGKSLAFAYDKLNLTRPIIATGLVAWGQPILVPMLLDRDGRWIKRKNKKTKGKK
jgi:hypothetical protein